MWKLGLVGLVVVASVGCVMPVYRTGDWPAGVPAEDRFAAVYESDARNREIQSAPEYFKWVLSFYQGNGIVGGWTSQQATLAKLMGDEYGTLEPRVTELGRIVAGEWAKDNKVRRIDTDLLVLWGHVLKSGAKERRGRDVVELVTADAQSVIAGTLAKSDVRKDRYVAVMAMK